MTKSNILKTTVSVATLLAITFSIISLKPVQQSKADYVTAEVKERKQEVEESINNPENTSVLQVNTSSSEPKLYKSGNKEGFIGYFKDKPIDNPIDNIFHINIDRKIKGNETFWLEYELYGIEDYTGIAHSINDQLAVGGYLVKKSNEWKKQREQLNPSDLKTGDNVVRFTLPESADYGFQVRNLAIHVQPFSEIEGNIQKQERKLVVNQPTNEYYYGNLAYLQGYVIGDNKSKAEVFIDGEKIRYNQGTFESLV